MTTNGLHIPDDEKVEVEEGQACEETWVELTNQRGEEPDHE